MESINTIETGHEAILVEDICHYCTTETQLGDTQKCSHDAIHTKQFITSLYTARAAEDVDYRLRHGRLENLTLNQTNGVRNDKATLGDRKRESKKWSKLTKNILIYNLK